MPSSARLAGQRRAAGQTRAGERRVRPRWALIAAVSLNIVLWALIIAVFRAL